MVVGVIKSVNTVQPIFLQFHPCGKHCRRLYMLKVCGIKVSSMKAGGEKGQKVFQENISSYIMVLILSNPLSLIVLKLRVLDKIG